MDTERIEGLIDSLRATRRDVAKANAELGEREIARLALKASIIGEMTSKGIAATPAEKAAGQDARLVAYAHDTIAAEQARDESLGDAEALRFRVQVALLECEDAMRTGHVEEDAAVIVPGKYDGYEIADDDVPVRSDDVLAEIADADQLALAPAASDEEPF